MTQERYQEYKQQLRDQGYNIPETTTNYPNEKTYKLLEDRIGPMPWNLIKQIGQTCRFCEQPNSILEKNTCCTGCSKLVN